MSLGVSIFLLVVGAVLTFAVDVSTSGFNLNTVGIILMAAGALGVVLSLLFWSSFSPYRRGATVVGGDTVVKERHVRRDLPSGGFTYPEGRKAWRPQAVLLPLRVCRAGLSRSGTNDEALRLKPGRR
jgi:hypothetical protein